MSRHVILIAGDDEDIRCSFGEMVGTLEHAEVVEIPVPSDVLDRVASGEIDQIIFCPASALRLAKKPAKRKAPSGEPTVFTRRLPAD